MPFFLERKGIRKQKINENKNIVKSNVLFLFVTSNPFCLF